MSVFDELFVLELANNHLGSLERGRRIVREFGAVVRANKVRAAIKLQFRDVDSFIHKRHRSRKDVRYIKKVAATHLPWESLRALVDETRAQGMITMTTPFDEVSVDKAVEFGVEVLKIASSDIRDKRLLRKIAAAGKPVIASTGGSSLRDIDNLVDFFGEAGIPFALNHCVSIYPSEDGELDLNQIDFLRARYPHITVGFSSHEMTDWRSSMLIAYAKGAGVPLSDTSTSMPTASRCRPIAPCRPRPTPGSGLSKRPGRCVAPRPTPSASLPKKKCVISTNWCAGSTPAATCTPATC